jgi:hypothetical protein
MRTPHRSTPESTPRGLKEEEPVAGPPPTTEGWTPEDREPSAAESNFMSFALFGFLIIFGIGCLIVF